MPDDPAAPLPTPTNYQRTTGGNLCWQPPTSEHLQEMLPTYEILGILGRGGMGAVYKGRQRSLDRMVAIKILPPEAADNDMQFVERFKNEARTMAKMNHPAIVHVYDFGETKEGQLYIVMEFIDGTDVAKMIQSQGKLPEDYSLSITAHVCDALQYAHTRGVVHRDIKPANVLINMEGHVKVADFGLAKATDPSQMGLTKTNFAMGTPDFVSPEALSPGMVVDGRADLYAVGVMLYNMLTGTIPRGAFRMPSATLKTDARFDKIILKAMEMDRENRYQTALDLRRDLDVILTTPAAEVGVQALPAQQAAPPQKPMGKSPGAPQHKEGSAGVPSGAAQPARSVPADKNARSPQAADRSVRAPAKKSNAGMIYGIAAVVVIAGAAFMFSGGEKKPAPAPQAVAETKSETKPTAPPPAASTPKPAESKPAPAPAAVATGEMLTFGGHRYQMVLEKKKHWQATEAAKKMGGHLAFISSKEENEWIFKNVKLPPGNGDPIYIGGSLKDKSWKWEDGQPVDMSLWGGNGPNSGNQALAIRNGRWDDVNNGESYFFLIEWDDDGTGKPAGSLAASSGTAVPSPASDSVAPLLFGGHRYQLVMEQLKWNEAKAKAEAMGGHLATISTQEEHEQLEAALLPQFRQSGPKNGANFFLGGQRKTASDGWKWITGESITLNRWESGNSDDGDKNDLVIQCRPLDGNTKLSWDDVGKGLQVPAFLVEWDNDAPAKPAAIAAAPTPASVPTMPAVASASTAPSTPATGMSPLLGSDPRLAQLAAGFKARHEADALQPFNTALAALNKSYVANGVSRARTAAKAKGSLAEVTALDAEKTAIEQGRAVPEEDDSDTPDSLKTLRTTYRTAHAKHAAERDAKAAPLYDLYLGALDAYIAELTRADKIAAARKVQVFRDDIALQKPGAGAMPSSASTTPTPAVPNTPPPVNPTAVLALKDGITNSLGMKFLPVKGTEVLFCIHETRYKDYAAYAADAQGVDGSWKNQTYDGYAITERNEDHPVAQVSWEDAQAFCAWLSKKEGKIYRLPTDEEWSVAVGLGRAEKRPKGTTPAMLNQKETTEFPWGTNWPPPKGSGNFSDESRKAKAPNGSAGYLDGYDDGFPTTAPVMSFKPNKLGLYDLGGNVWEWCEDWYDNAQKDRVMRGASWNEHERRYPLSSYRHGTPSRRRNLSGFRCVLVPSGSAPAAATSRAVSPPSSAATKPAVRAPKMNEHELAEWAIATGGSVQVLFGTPPAYQKIAIASELPHGRFIITYMTVNCDKVPGKDLSPLASAQEVGQVLLENSLLPDKTCPDLTPLRQMPKLRNLSIRYLDAAAVDVIASLAELKELYNRGMPEGSLEKIAKLKQLVTLESPAIIGPGIAALKSCKQLRTITNGSTTGVSDEDIRLLAAALPDLTNLTIGSTAITNACLPSLLSLKSLKDLRLQSNELDDSVMEPLGKLPSLATLCLTSSKIVGSNLDVLKKFSSLRELHLDGCSITDDALDVLVQIKGLTKLQFRNTKVTDAGIAKFKAARPGFNVSK